MQIRKIAGLLFIIIGLLLMTNVIGLSTVVYPEKFWYSLYPDGTSSNPTMLTAGSTTQLKAQVIYYDTITKISLPGTYLTWTVKASIAETGQTITLVGNQVVPSVENRYATFVFTTSWNVPAAEGKTYTFNWLAILRNDNHVEYGTQTTKTYAKTIAAEPDGYFTINGENANEQTTHIVSSPTLSLGFVGTKNVAKITNVYIEVWKGESKTSTVALTGSGGSYTASYTLPSPGTYKFKGFYTWTSGTAPIQKMSVVTSWGTEGTDGLIDGDVIGGFIGVNQLAGIGSIAVGAVLAFARYPKKRHQ